MTRYIHTESEIADVVKDTGMTPMQARRHLDQRKHLAAQYREIQRQRVNDARVAWAQSYASPHPKPAWTQLELDLEDNHAQP